LRSTSGSSLVTPVMTTGPGCRFVHVGDLSRTADHGPELFLVEDSEEEVIGAVGTLTE